MGDEVRRTQHGNNNAYCQDNALSWFDWDDVARHADILRFARSLIQFHQGSAFFAIAHFGASRERLKLHGMAFG